MHFSLQQCKSETSKKNMVTNFTNAFPNTMQPHLSLISIGFAPKNPKLKSYISSTIESIEKLRKNKAESLPNQILRNPKYAFND